MSGMRVVAVARRKERLEELQRHMHAMGVPLVNFLPVVCDITKEAEVCRVWGVGCHHLGYAQLHIAS